MKQYLKSKIENKKTFLNKMRSEYNRYISLSEKYPTEDYNKSFYSSTAGRIMKDINALQDEIKKLELELESLPVNAPLKDVFRNKNRMSGIECRDNSN